MGSRALVHSQQLRGEMKQKDLVGEMKQKDLVGEMKQKDLVGEMKQKNLAGIDGRNRRVLQDIGNLANGRIGVQGKKQGADVLDPNVKVVKANVASKVAPAATKKVVEKKIPEPENVIVISSDECSKKTKSRKESRAFTSILTARSKAACGLAKKPNSVEDIDASDVKNELAVVEYVDEIYKFYKETEVDGRVHDYMHLQSDINAKMRSILVDWLVEVHRKFELMPETLYLTINIMDRLLAVKVVPRRELQLVGISSMLIACKYEEIWAPEVNDFVCISDNAYVREQVLVMEKTILEKLEWYLTVPTPYVFLVRYIKASDPSDKVMENMAFYLAELGLMQYPIIVAYSPSVIAASAVYAARYTLDKAPFWTETLKHHTGYNEESMKVCAVKLMKCHAAAAENKLKALYKKFSSSERGAVALLSPAKSITAAAK